jgi:hypothetical protein
MMSIQGRAVQPFASEVSGHQDFDVPVRPSLIDALQYLLRPGIEINAVHSKSVRPYRRAPIKLTQGTWITSLEATVSLL